MTLVVGSTAGPGGRRPAGWSSTRRSWASGTAPATRALVAMATSGQGTAAELDAALRGP